MSEMLFLSDMENCIQDNVELKKIRLFQKGLIIEVPSELTEMPEELKGIYYPYDKKPEVILWGNNGTVHITFQRTGRSLQRSQIYEAGKAVADFMRKIEPQSEINCVHLWDRGEKEIAWFVMNLYGGIGRKHIKFVMETFGYFTLGTMTYPMEDACKWETVIMHAFTSLSECEDRNENSRI